MLRKQRERDPQAPDYGGRMQGKPPAVFFPNPGIGWYTFRLLGRDPCTVLWGPSAGVLKDAEGTQMGSWGAFNRDSCEV